MAIDHPQTAPAASKRLEEIMNLKIWVRAVLVGILLAALGIPPRALTSWAKQQEGPQKPAPAQQPTTPAPPTGQQQPPQAGQAPAAPQTAIAVESNVVNIDAVVTDQDGDILTNLQKENFRVLDNNQPQQISNFAPSEAPITIVILMEFSKLGGEWYAYEAKTWAYNFVGHLNEKDYVAFKTFDFHTHILVDFTRNKQEVAQAAASLYFPDFREANLFDALLETLDELRDVKGKKSILLLASGYDTFSKHTLDQTLKRVKESDVPIYSVGMAEELQVRNPRGDSISYLQAKNQLTTFADMTGGYAWFPRFQGEMNSIFTTVATYLRSQYTVGFTPSTSPDGKYHKLKLEIVDEQGNPMMQPDRKGKMKKVIVIARQGYTSPKPSAGD
jgi:VWFA-related protein